MRRRTAVPVRRVQLYGTYCMYCHYMYPIQPFVLYIGTVSVVGPADLQTVFDPKADMSGFEILRLQPPRGARWSQNSDLGGFFLGDDVVSVV
jgi:hypothetical protein